MTMKNIRIQTIAMMTSGYELSITDLSCLPDLIGG